MINQEDIAKFGQRIIRELANRNIHIKDFLKELKCRYPDERGLTENGFRYSLKHGTLKVSLLGKISDQLDYPIEYWFTEGGKYNMPEHQEYVKRIETRLRELETDKENLQELVGVLKEKVKELTK
ncbi:MAG: hypothetical protein ACOYNC_16375 [Bacteroidales bacterium]